MTGPSNPEKVRVFIGSDPTQWLATQVLIHSLQSNTSLPVEITILGNLANSGLQGRIAQGTGFSLDRFSIPERCGYRGRAIYLDADMLVLSDIAEIWNAPMSGEAAIIYPASAGADGHVARFAVMLLDCAKLDWKLNDIIEQLNEGQLAYSSLIHDMTLLSPSQMQASLASGWNSLDRFDAHDTHLVHYTNMATQPWVYPHHELGHLWYEQLIEAISDGAVRFDDMLAQVALKHVSPNLPRWIGYESPVGPVQKLLWMPPYLVRYAQDRSGIAAYLSLQMRRVAHNLPAIRKLWKTAFRPYRR